MDKVNTNNMLVGDTINNAGEPTNAEDSLICGTCRVHFSLADFKKFVYHKFMNGCCQTTFLNHITKQQHDENGDCCSCVDFDDDEDDETNEEDEEDEEEEEETNKTSDEHEMMLVEDGKSKSVDLLILSPVARNTDIEENDNMKTGDKETTTKLASEDEDDEEGNSVTNNNASNIEETSLEIDTSSNKENRGETDNSFASSNGGDSSDGEEMTTDNNIKSEDNVVNKTLTNDKTTTPGKSIADNISTEQSKNENEDIDNATKNKEEESPTDKSANNNNNNIDNNAKPTLTTNDMKSSGRRTKVEKADGDEDNVIPVRARVHNHLCSHQRQMCKHFRRALLDANTNFKSGNSFDTPSGWEEDERAR